MKIINDYFKWARENMFILSAILTLLLLVLFASLLKPDQKPGEIKQAAPPVARMTVIGTAALDFDQIDTVEHLTFPRAGLQTNHEIVRVWYEDGRYFDLEQPTYDEAYALLIYLALNAGIEEIKS
jgi:hypothetical protein